MTAPMDAAQMPPPPRIKAWPWSGKRISGQWHVAGLGETTEYVRADLFTAQAAELERLQAALRKARDTTAGIAQHLLDCRDTAGTINHAQVIWPGVFADLQRSTQESIAALEVTL